MKVKDLISELSNFDPNQDLHFMTLTEFGYVSGTKFGKTLTPDLREEKGHPDDVLFRLVYHQENTH